jgi:hypothetical protein
LQRGDIVLLERMFILVEIPRLLGSKTCVQSDA